MNSTARVGHAGSARSAARDRGTVLLMVIGVLALLAVIAVAYVTIGRADRVTSTVMTTQQRIDDQSQAFADYFAGVIRDDLFSVFPERLASNSALDPKLVANYQFRRAAWDYPDVDPLMKSSRTQITPANGEYRFNPAGTVLNPWGSKTTRDPRRASNPWLASHGPVRYMDDRVNGNTFPNAFNVADLAQYTDLFGISVFAPDGKFVNLANLRGNFDAEPGIGTGAGGRPRMSERLTLINRTTGLPYATTAASRRWDNLAVTPALAASPSTWGSMQLGASRPAVDNLLPGDPNHILNQWCDTDGDGFVDSRWAELVDSFEAQGVKWLLPRDGRTRYFFAARAVDLSGMVNVNTATDFVYAPGYTPAGVFAALSPSEPAPNATSQRYFPAGFGPADVDLRRLLMMSDFYFEFGAAYDSAWQPTPATNPANYSQYDAARAADAGRAAYAAITATRDRGIRLAGEDTVGGTGNNSALLDENADRLTLVAGNPNPLDPVLRSRHYESFGLDPSGATDSRDLVVRRQTAAGPREARLPFGPDSELDLRAFNGVNDSSILSPLEQATGGRGGTGANVLARFDPLRSNRPLYTELQGRPDTSTGTGILPNNEARFLQLTDIRRLLTTVNGARPLTNSLVSIAGIDSLSGTELKTDFVRIRNRIAPLNVIPGSPPSVEPQPATNTVNKNAAINELYFGYLSALAPYRDRERYPSAWMPMMNLAAFERRNSLSYGGTSVELAARFAAHLAINTADTIDVEAADRAFEPTTFVLTLDQSPTAATPNTALSDAISDSNAVKSVVPSDFPTNAPANETRSKQVLLYGIEPQPFLIEAMYTMLYTDAPDSAYGASDDSFDPGNPPGGPGNPPQSTPINIDWSRDLENGDYLGEVIAFQLTNPFDVPIPLTKAGGEPLYYLEYAGRFFPLANLSDDGETIGSVPLKLEAGKTRTYYAMSPGSFAAIDERLRNAVQESNPADFSGNFRTHLNTRFGSDCQLIPMTKRTNLTEHENGTPVSILGQNMRFNDLVGLQVTDPHDSTMIKLWRANRTSGDPSEFRSDILIDRLRQVPGSEKSDLAGLAKSLDTLGTEDINGTVSGLDPGSFVRPPPSRTLNGDNIGFSVAAWRSVRRPTDPTFGNLAKSVLPPWCIEAKKHNARNGDAPYNVGDGVDALGTSSFDASDFDNADNDSVAFENLVGMLDEWGRTSDRLNDQISKEAKDKTGNDLLSSNSMVNDFTTMMPRSAVYRDLAAQFSTVGEEGNLMLFTRVGDLLLPMAIGPSYDPALEIAGGGDPNLAEEFSRMTLSEVLALASDYYSPDSTYANTWMEFYTDLGHVDVTASPEARPILSRGCLVLDRFVPYFDANNNGLFDYDTDDQPLGNGVPLALNVLSQFRTADFKLQLSHGTLNQAVPGLVNINTAPLPVMRVVPMLSPDPGDLTTSATYVNEPWVRTPVTNPLGGPALVLYNPANTTANDPFDLAASVVSYRDKCDVATRPSSVSGDRGRAEFAEEFSDLRQPNAWSARKSRTQIPALREEQGIRSEGELGAVVVRERRLLPTGDVQSSIDRLARDGEPALWPGLVGANAKKNYADSVTAERDADLAVDDQAEKLSILNAAINTVSVRSDVFCVWFVLRGYAPTDVNELSTATTDPEPMVPSVERRFVMVVDRSNVTDKSDKPRILLFKEVPIE